MWEFKRVEPNNKESLSNYLKNAGVGNSFFCSAYSLDIFLNCGIKKLYLAENGSDERLVLLREKTFGNDVRILFSASDGDGLVAAIKNRFDPVYVAYNLISDDGLPYPRSEKSELIADVAMIADLGDRKIKSAYNAFLKSHSGIRFEKINASHKDALIDFFDKWDQRPVTKLRIKGMENDRFFLDNYLDDPGIDGEVAIDDSKIIGYTVIVPGCLAGSAIGLINKCIRGYNDLGTRLVVSWARRAMEKGFTKAAIGEIEPDGNNCFKSRFAKNGKIIKLYAYEIFRSPKITLHGDYLGTIT